LKKFRLLKSKIIVNTFAFFLFSVCSSVGFTVLYELLFSNIGTKQWVYFRIIYNLVKITGSYFCAQITHWVRKKIANKTIADGTSLSIYQIPLYNIIGLIIGIDIYQLLIISIICIIDNMSMGWGYGIILDWLENKKNST